MGLVALAKDEALGRQVALKIVRPELTSPDAVDRFRTEAQAMARVDQRNVVRILSFGEHRGAPFFAMEFIDGRSLRDIMDADDNALAFDHAAGVLGQIASGLEAIHESGARHGDVKPGNVLIGNDFRVAITDLGLAEWLRHEREKRSEATQARGGTPAYLAPEAITQEKVDELFRDRLDVYSLGAMAFELFTGESLFSGNAFAMMRAHVYDEPRFASDIRPELPASLDTLLAEALRKDPSKRPSAKEFRIRLAKIVDDVRQTSQPKRKVLVVDDDQAFRQLIGLCVMQAFPDAEVVEAHDGADALSKLGKSRYGCVITDLDLPEMNGIELTAAIQERFGTSISVMVITGEGGAAEEAIFSSLGVKEFFVKPINPVTFIAQLKESSLASGSHPRIRRPSVIG